MGSHTHAAACGFVAGASPPADAEQVPDTDGAGSRRSGREGLRSVCEGRNAGSCAQCSPAGNQREAVEKPVAAHSAMAELMDGPTACCATGHDRSSRQTMTMLDTKGCRQDCETQQHSPWCDKAAWLQARVTTAGDDMQSRIAAAAQQRT